MSELDPRTLREYALLADGERGALVGPRGELAWMCFPGWADPAVFSGLLGGRGDYTLRPVGRFVWGGYYEPGTLIWRNRWTTDEDEVVECREALALPGERDRAIVLRRVLPLKGRAKLEVVLDPRAEFGAKPMRDLRRRQNGGWTARAGDLHLLWLGADDATEDEGALRKVFTVNEGEQLDFILVLARDPAGLEPLSADRWWSATEEGWRNRVPHKLDAVGARDARQACAVLSGLTRDGGGTVGAATTSLPERAEAGRNYDYRYVWIRDQTYVGQAAAAAGADDLLESAVRFVRERLLEDGATLKPVYTTDGGAVPGESPLDLPGYPGGEAVVGNDAARQFQLDAFGEALLLFAACGSERLTADDWRAVEAAATAIEQRWHQPDAGIWELDPEQWTHSMLICAAGLRAVAATPEAHRERARWTTLADTITAHTSQHCLHRDGHWQRSPTDERLDAALLLPPIRGAVPADDPRTLATLAAFVRELTEDGFAYRFRHDPRALGEAEGAFLLCGFIVCLAKLQQRDLIGAVQWFERNRTACGPAGLLSEEFDVQQRQLRGNLPQAFVHAMLLESATRLAAAL
jgi:GH15 family glucan-1,4-alpha-glucosidase